MEKKEKYQISSSVDDEIIEIILTGEFIESDVEELQNKVADIIEAKGLTNVLVDIRTFNGRASIISPRLKVNVAVVDRPENAAVISYLETTASNAGRSLKCFTDIDKARTWLKSK